MQLHLSTSSTSSPCHLSIPPNQEPEPEWSLQQEALAQHGPRKVTSGLAQPHGLRNMRCNVLPEAFCDSYSSTSTTPGCPGTLHAFKPCTNCKHLLSDTCTNTCSLQILLVFCGNCFAQLNKLLPFISRCVLQLGKKKKSEALAVCSSCFSGEKASNQHSGFFLSWVNSSCETNLSKVICSMDFSHLHY